MLDFQNVRVLLVYSPNTFGRSISYNFQSREIKQACLYHRFIPINLFFVDEEPVFVQQWVLYPHFTGTCLCILSVPASPAVWDNASYLFQCSVIVLYSTRRSVYTMNMLLMMTLADIVTHVILCAIIPDPLATLIYDITKF